MTVRDLIGVVLRNWHLMVVGALVSLGGLYQATHVPPVYYTQYFVVVLAPRTTAFPNTLEDPAYGMAPMAGLVVSDFNEGKRAQLFASGDTMLHGEGVREGNRVRIPNEGSQWQPLYGRPNIDVQVVGADPEAVAAKAKRIGSELLALLDRRQADMGIAPAMRMTAIVSSPDPVVSQAAGARTRAALAVAAAGSIATTMGVVQFDRWRTGRLARREGERDAEAAPPIHRE